MGQACCQFLFNLSGSCFFRWKPQGPGPRTRGATLRWQLGHAKSRRGHPQNWIICTPWDRRGSMFHMGPISSKDKKTHGFWKALQDAARNISHGPRCEPGSWDIFWQRSSKKIGWNIWYISRPVAQWELSPTNGHNPEFKKVNCPPSTKFINMPWSTNNTFGQSVNRTAWNSQIGHPIWWPSCGTIQLPCNLRKKRPAACGLETSRRTTAPLCWWRAALSCRCCRT